MAFHNIPPNGFPDIPDMEDLEAVVKDVASLKTGVAGLATDVSNLSDNKANQITIAPFFNAETAYEVGDLVYYNGLSYRCTNDHEGEWDADDFAATTVSNELATLKSGLTNKTPYINLSLTGGLSDLDDQLNTNFSNMPQGVSCGRVGNQAGVYSALAVRYSDTYATVSLFDVSTGDNLIWHKDTQGHSIYNVSDILTSAQLYRDLVSIPVGSTVVETSRNGDYELMSTIQINSNVSVCGNIKAYFSSGKWYIQSDASVTTNDASICCVFRHV